MKKQIMFFVAIIILMIGGVSKNTMARDRVSVVVHSLKGVAAEKAEGLIKFYQNGWLITSPGKSKKIGFIMKCCSDSTLMIYFPTYDKAGERTDCCPVFMLHRNVGEWFSYDKPENGRDYSPKETRAQARIIKRALKFLQPKGFILPDEAYAKPKTN